MRMSVKKTSCSYCLSLLVVDNGTVTCEENHELPQTGWHKETWAKLEPVIEYQRSLIE